MTRGRRKSQREAAASRQLEAHERAVREQREVEERLAADRRLARKWPTERLALDRLGVLSRDLEKLHREESRLLRERDELVFWLRRRGQSWTILSARTS